MKFKKRGGGNKYSFRTKPLLLNKLHLKLFRDGVPSYQIYDLVDASSSTAATASSKKATPGQWATWISTNRFCHIEGVDQLVVKNSQVPVPVITMRY
jgi:hypothetical protein